MISRLPGTTTISAWTARTVPVTAVSLVCLLTLPITAVYGRGFPEPNDSYVNDYANVIDRSTEADIRQMLTTLRAQHGIEAVVVTIESMSRYRTGHSIESFATGLFNTWGIGDPAANDGVLILVAIQDRRMRIELGSGYGNFHDGDMQRVVDRYMLPEFREGWFGEGIRRGTAAVIGELTGKWPEETSVTDRMGTWAAGVRREAGEWAFWAVVAVLLVATAISIGLVSRWALRYRPRKCPSCRTRLARLDEKADDVYLESGQQLEEFLKSVDYDIWKCSNCNEHLLYRHRRWFTSYRRCPSCEYRTVQSNSRVLQPATYVSDGLKEIVQDCSHCDYHAREIVVIPQKTESSVDSGSAFGSSSSGPSFGGGSSSGGGASGKW